MFVYCGFIKLLLSYTSATKKSLKIILFVPISLVMFVLWNLYHQARVWWVSQNNSTLSYRRLKTYVFSIQAKRYYLFYTIITNSLLTMYVKRDYLMKQITTYIKNHNTMYHKWYMGVREQYGNYIYRDDECSCGCVRRVVLNDENREEIESYTMNDSTTISEPAHHYRVPKYKTINAERKRKALQS